MRAKWLIITILLAFSACAPTLSEVPRPAPVPDPSEEIQVVGADRASIINDLSAAINGAESDEPRLTEWMRIEQDIAGRALIAGNRIDLLKDGPQTFESMFEAMREARHHIHLETFIIDDESVGSELADILIERRRDGVEVRMVYDSFGALNTEDAYFARLRENGVELHHFHPVNPIENIQIWRVNNRHHRKIVVVDGKIGFIGGINISATYSSSSVSSARGPDQGWRDTQIKVEGPGVAQLQEIFTRFWLDETGAPLEGGDYFPHLGDAGKDLTRVVHSTGGDAEADIYHVYLTAIEHARQKIWITQGYFSPDERFLTALQAAAERGVDVRLLLPGMTDSWITINSSRNHYSMLLEKGIRIFERKDALQHAKTALIDGIWSTIGSTNLDYRSFLHSNEANIVIWGRGFGSKMEETFLEDQAKNQEIKFEDWHRRSWMQRAIESLANMFKYWL
ncbi:MAG: phospholipase D-like domain-containing protein [Desulfobacterales bacterium]